MAAETERAAATSSPPARVVSVSKRFGAVEALRDVSLAVPPGEVTGLLGPNGAGKTTLLRILTGLARPDAGAVELFGAPVHEPASRRWLGYLPEVIALPPVSRVSEFLRLQGALAGIDPTRAGARARHLAERLGFGDVLDRRGGALSKGQRRRVGLASALIAEPKILLLDEPTADLDPVGRRDFETLMLEERSRGTAVVLSSHLLLEMEPLTSRVAMLHRGALLAEGSVGALLPTRFLVDVALVDWSESLREATAHLLPVFHASERRMTVASNDPDLAGAIRRLLDELGVRYSAITTRAPNLRDLFFALLEGKRS